MIEWTHNQKYFFKYVTMDTARKILESGKLRWSAPRLFNDPFDIQFDMHVDYKEPDLISDAVSELWLVYSRKKEFEPKNRLGYFVREMSLITPRLTEADFKARVRKGAAESLAAQKIALPKLHAWAREQLEIALVLCLTEAPSNILMWSHYADWHKGVALRFTTLKASSWAAARPVMYQQKMPLLFDHEQLLRFLTGRIEIDKDRFFNESIFTKSIDWRYEKEWRVVWHGQKKVDFEDTKFNPEELSGIFLGCRIEQKDGEEIVRLAKRLNTNVEVFKGRKSERTFTVDFEKQN
jgi:hypothetical protein